MASHITKSAVCAALLFTGAGAYGCADAADLDVYRVERAVPAGGLPCDSPRLAAFSSIWEGHFSGGMSRYLGPGRTIAVDWRDEKLCFPNHVSCSRYVFGMRQDFHRPEGYFTCLLIR